MTHAINRNGDRPGERRFAFDPAETAADATVIFIGHISSPWISRDECPKNMAAARETGRPATLHVDAPFREALDGLSGYSHAVVLSWFDRADRNLAVQKPRHAERPSGTFALRSPVRPNPIGLHVVRLLSVDIERGLLGLDAIDLLDGTPVLDIKPYFASTDSVPEATRPDRA